MSILSVERSTVAGQRGSTRETTSCGRLRGMRGPRQLEARQRRLFIVSYVEYPVQPGSLERLQDKGAESTQDQFAFGGAYPLVHGYQPGRECTADEIEVGQVKDNAWSIVRSNQPFAEALDIGVFRCYPGDNVQDNDATHDPHAAPQQIPALRARNIDAWRMRLAWQHRATSWAKRPGWCFGYGVRHRSLLQKGLLVRGVNYISRHGIRIVRNPTPPYI